VLSGLVHPLRKQPNAISAAYFPISAKFPHLSAQDGLLNLTWGGPTLAVFPKRGCMRAGGHTVFSFWPYASRCRVSPALHLKQRRISGPCRALILACLMEMGSLPYKVSWQGALHAPVHKKCHQKSSTKLHSCKVPSKPPAAPPPGNTAIRATRSGAFTTWQRSLKV